MTTCKIIRNGDAVVTGIDIGFRQSNGETLIQKIDGILCENDLAIESVFPIERIIIDPDKKYPLIDREEWIKSN